jgi:hypothetical protein
MSSGFRYVLAGACVIAVLFVALSISPYLKQLDIVWRPPGASHQSVTGQQQPAFPQPPVPRTAAPPPPMPSSALVGQAQPQPSHIVLQSPAQAAVMVVDELDSPESTQWLMTVDNAIVRKKPGGDPCLASCITRAPLTVYSGSYLREVRRESGWVLILSPSKTLGWVHERQVRPANM